MKPSADHLGACCSPPIDPKETARRAILRDLDPSSPLIRRVPSGVAIHETPSWPVSIWSPVMQRLVYLGTEE